MTPRFEPSVFHDRNARPELARIDGRDRTRELSEPELMQWAEQTTVSSAIDRLSGYGAIAFWILVAGLIAARVLLIDAGTLRPAASPTESALSIPHIKL